MTNYVPIPTMPQAYQMTSHPTFPTQQPLIQHNPFVNPLQDISGKIEFKQYKMYLMMYYNFKVKYKKNYKKKK